MSGCTAKEAVEHNEILTEDSVMTYNNGDVKPTRQINSQLADLISGFKEVLKQCGASDTPAIEFTIIDQKLEKEGSSLLPQGCKHKCWYNPALNSTQCGIICSI